MLKPKVPVRRIEFHEITEEAVNEALKHARDINESLVRAQESRRILDRLYGYTLSPVLWKKVQTGLSAGRVQSVAVRLIVEREEARRAFRTATYWDLEARLTGEGREFPATLVRIGDARVASGKDFDPRPARSKNARRRHLEEDDARRLASALERQLPWTGHRGRREARPRAAGAAVHDVDADAGGQPQAWLLDRSARCRSRSGCFRASRWATGDGRPHHLPPHRLARR